MKSFRAIYQNGVFWPLDPVDLPEGCVVKLEVTVLENGEITDAEKALLDQAIAEYQKNPDKGRPWREVLEEIRGKLCP